MTHVAPWKKEEVQHLVKLIEGAPVVAVVNVQGIPGAQMAKMRKTLRGSATIKVAKNSLLNLALEEVGKRKDGLGDLASRIDGQTAIIATTMNPFALFRKLASAKAKAPARGGEIAPADIEVRKGETPFKPGPIVGDLQRAGIPAAIEEGKVVIKQDKVLVKAGAAIPAATAQMLTRLEIYPLEVGMALKGAYEGGLVYGPDVLNVDPAQFLEKLQTAARNAMNVAVFAAYPTKQTMVPLLQKAHRGSMGLALEAAFVEKGTADLVLSKASAQALALARKLKDEALDEDLRSKLAPAPAGAGASD